MQDEGRGNRCEVFSFFVDCQVRVVELGVVCERRERLGGGVAMLVVASF